MSRRCFAQHLNGLSALPPLRYQAYETSAPVPPFRNERQNNGAGTLVARYMPVAQTACRSSIERTQMRPVMQVQAPSPTFLVRFGVFELDLRTGELRKAGARLRLPNQAFIVLAELLERPNELVTREEFRIRLWPTNTFVDFEHGLNAAVRRVRECLAILPSRRDTSRRCRAGVIASSPRCSVFPLDATSRHLRRHDRGSGSLALLLQCGRKLFGPWQTIILPARRVARRSP